MEASTLKRIIENVAGQVRALYAYVNIWTQLTPAQKEQADALNYYAHFTVHTLEAVRQMVFLKIGNIVDDSRRAMSLRRLIKEAQENPGLLPFDGGGELKTVVQTLDGHADLIRRVLRHRGSFIAHRQQPGVGEEVTLGEVRVLISALADSLNTISSLHDRSVYSIDYGSQAQATSRLVADLVHLHHQRKEDLDRQLRDFENSSYPDP